MKFCSRSTLAGIVGIINILFYISFLIFFIVLLVKLNWKQNRNEVEMASTIFLLLIVICVVMALVSGVFVTGIIKRRHELITPWLLLSAILFVIDAVSYIYAIIYLVNINAETSNIFQILFMGLLGFAIFGSILLTIYKLYVDIRKQNYENGTRLMRGQKEYQEHYNY